MKLTKDLVKQFEDDYNDNGTKTAIYNLIWKIAAELLNDIGVCSIKTTEQPKQ